MAAKGLVEPIAARASIRPLRPGSFFFYAPSQVAAAVLESAPAVEIYDLVSVHAGYPRSRAFASCAPARSGPPSSFPSVVGRALLSCV